MAPRSDPATRAGWTVRRSLRNVLLTASPALLAWFPAASGATGAPAAYVHGPTPDQFTVNQWPGTLQSMVPSNVFLTAEDLDLLTKFLQYHASDM